MSNSTGDDIHFARNISHLAREIKHIAHPDCFREGHVLFGKFFGLKILDPLSGFAADEKK
jgi:hypothetical protein